MSANLYIVPYDFTSVGDAALKTALFLAKPRKTAIQLLNIVSEKSKAQETLNRLNEVIKNLDLSIGSVEVTPNVVIGNIFEDIPKVAKEHDARIIIMGTHGAVGMQKVFGSFAIKVLSNSDIPFVIVQEGGVLEKLENIVIPIEISKESLQILNVAGEVALTFDSKIHVIAEHETDERLNQQLKVRVSLVEKHYKEKGIDATVHIIKERGSFNQNIIKYVMANNGDMIALSYFTSSILPQFEKFTQNVITNDKKIPCLVINAKANSFFYF